MNMQKRNSVLVKYKNIFTNYKKEERAKSQRLSSFFVLPWKDSNPHRRNQNPTCYHYTTRQGVCVISF